MPYAPRGVKLGAPEPSLSHELPEIGAVIAEKYRLERLLGRGGMGAVFEATHLITGKRVAIKCQLPRQEATADDVERFLREARAAAMISHPNVADIYDVGEASGTFFLVMQLLEGAPLSALMEHGPLPIGPAVRTLSSAMRGVQAAHKKGVVHRDLKPDNIFLCSGGEGISAEPKVLDFGIAKLSALTNSMNPSLTHSGAVMGTPHYMSPEQARDSRGVDERTDIYALGVILYELIGGVRPFEAPSLTALLLKVARGDAAPLRSVRPSVPVKLEEIVARAMALDPGMRFQTVGSFIDALQPFAGPVGLDPRGAAEGAGELPGSVATETPLAVGSIAPSKQRLARRRAAWAVAVGALAIIALALWLRHAAQSPLVQQAPPTPAPTAVPTPAATAVAPAPAASPPSAPAPSDSALPPPAPPEVVQPARGIARPTAVRRRPASTPAPTSAVLESPAPAPPSASSAGPAAHPDEPETSHGKGRLRVDLAKDQF